MKSIKTVTITLLMLAVIINSKAQDIRKLTLKSDVIFLCDRYSSKDSTVYINDYTSQYFKIYNEIDTIVKNNGNYNPLNQNIKFFANGENYFSYGDGCQMAFGIEMGRRYYNLVFLKKVGKQYQVLTEIEREDDYTYYQDLIKQIKSVLVFEKIKNPTERYQKTFNWYIEQGEIPSQDFMAYYKQAGVIKTDSVQFTTEQTLRAKELFLTGKEGLGDMICEKYPVEYKNYYLKKLKDIESKQKRDYKDYYQFYEIINKLTNNFDDNYDDINSLNNNLLNNADIEVYDKDKIIKHLIKLIEEEY